MIERRRLSKPKSMEAAAIQRMALFGAASLLPGEDSADYNHLLAEVCAAVKPADAIEGIWTHDVISLEWEILRWRRIKTSLLKAATEKALRNFLRENLDYQRYEDEFADDLAEQLRDILPGNPTDGFARKLARRYAGSESEAVKEVDPLLEQAELDVDRMIDAARDRVAEALTQAYARQDPDAIKEVDTILHGNGGSMQELMADAIMQHAPWHGEDYLSVIERIDGLTADAESRRNASLRAIDRRRALFGEALRRTVQDVEDGKFEVIEAPPAKGKDAA